MKYRSIVMAGLLIILFFSCLHEHSAPIASSFSVEIAEDKTAPVIIKLQNDSYGADDARAGDMFRDLGQFKAYIENIDSFDQLYIIQQGGRGVTREQVINKLRKELLKPENLMEILDTIRSKPQMNRSLLKSIVGYNDALEELTRLIEDSNSVLYAPILVTK